VNESSSQPSPSAFAPEVLLARERTKQASAAAWTAGLSALFAMGTAAAEPTWPVAAAIAAVAAMVAVVCSLMLRH